MSTISTLDLTCRAGGLHFQSLNGPYTLPKFDIFRSHLDHILVSGSRQPRSPGTCSIHTSKCCSHHHSPLLSLLASTHPCQTPGIGSIALSGPLEKKPLWPRHFTIHCILDCLISGQYHVQKCAEWLSVRKPQLRFFLPDQLWHGVQVLLKLCALCSGKRFISVYDVLDSVSTSQVPIKAHVMRGVHKDKSLERTLGIGVCWFFSPWFSFNPCATLQGSIHPERYNHI